MRVLFRYREKLGRARRILLAVLCLPACGGPDSRASVAGANPPSSPPVAPSCVAPTGISASPERIEEVVALANGLRNERSDPLTLPCLIESLERPLGVLASLSVFSFQPSTEERSPRFFLFSGPLVLTVVPAGKGKNLLELSTHVSDTRSIKGEVAFPLASPLDPGAPYDRVRDGNGTTCGGCHGFERSSTDVTVTQGFESDVFRPLASQEVDLAFLRGEYAACNAEKEPERCAMLTAIFGRGELVPQSFGSAVRTIYENQ